MNMKKPRSSAEEVRQFILDDLEEAINVLPVNGNRMNMVVLHVVLLLH